MINITIRELQLDGDTAMKLIKLIKKEEPEIWKVLKGELTEALNIQNVSNCSHEWKSDTFDQMGFCLTEYCDLCDETRDTGC